MTRSRFHSSRGCADGISRVSKAGAGSPSLAPAFLNVKRSAIHASALNRTLCSGGTKLFRDQCES